MKDLSYIYFDEIIPHINLYCFVHRTNGGPDIHEKTILTPQCQRPQATFAYLNQLPRPSSSCFWSRPLWLSTLPSNLAPSSPHLSMSSDGSIICGVQNGSLLIFYEERVVQSIPNITTAALSGDAQWLIAYDGNVTLSTYARKRDSVISWILTVRTLITREWIQSPLLRQKDGFKGASYAISGDETFLFVSSVGTARRYLLTDLTSSYLPNDIAYESFSSLMTSNMNGSRVAFNDEDFLDDSISNALVVDIAGPRYPARSVCQDDTWHELKPDNFTVTATRYAVVVQYVQPSAADCIDGGSRPIQELSRWPTPTQNNTNVTVAIFDDNNGPIQFIQEGLLLSDASTTTRFGIKLNDTQSRVQVWLTSVCVDAAASSEMEVFMFSHLTDATTSKGQNTIISYI
ncbi:hypothetical protein PROFUN_13394 [Planoprotostelium fungivorum]|uniref:Uncharacterized protein n=1 Tax=Planoprotostelium fungivorum TaxID=1890364 RepID=A0A2P6MZS6_9EUKA|nr:hypothetical protein PROFUN_13394 [Planoprotostelium fungivorum]